jgi:hypothetical protein
MGIALLPNQEATMETKATITGAEAKTKLKKKFSETLVALGGQLDKKGEDAVDELFDRTAGQPGAGVGPNWGRDHGFLLEVTKRIARAAMRLAKKEKAAKVTWKHVAHAANCLIPDISYYCRNSEAAGSRWETKGFYCDEWEDMPEN